MEGDPRQSLLRPLIKALRFDTQQSIEILEIKALDFVVLDRRNHREPVDSYLQLYELDAILLAGRDFFFLVDRPRCVRNIRFAVAEELESVAGPRPLHRYLNVRVLRRELLSDGDRDRLDCRGAGNDYLAGQLLIFAPASAGLGVVVSAA
jgi:hypothetical protein